MDSERLTDLELKYMQLERTVEQLSGVVAAHQRVIDGLVGELRATTSRLRDAGEPAPPAEKPPHY
jgi:uncharacterized coiled-coil protein SlyX